MYPAYHHSLTGSRIGWPESAPFAAALGFPACDIWLEKAMAAGVEGTLETLRSNGLKTSTTDMPVDFRGSQETFDAQFPALEKQAAFAAEIGCLKMTTRLDPSADVPKVEWRPIQLARMRAIAEVLSRYNVRLAVEFVGSADFHRAHPHEFIWRMPETMDLLSDVGFGAGLLLDSWHWHHAGAKPTDIVAAGHENIVHVHLNDAPEQFFDHVVDKERLMPGDGVVDLDGFLHALKTIGYDGAVSVEVFASALKTIPPEHGAKLGLASTMKIFRRLGIN